MVSQFELVLLGADDPLGESVLRLMEEREIAIGELHPLTLAEQAESTVSYAGEDWPCQSALGFNIGSTQALVVANRTPAARRLVERMRAEHPALPVAGIAEVDATAEVVARVLRVLDAVAGVNSAEAFVALPVAIAGKVGVDELSTQTRGLFNLDMPDPEVFPLQIAFNLMPLGNAESDTQWGEATARLLGKPIDIGYTRIQAPLFFGAVVALHVRTEQAPDLGKLRAAFSHAEGVTLMETDLPAGMPTPATDASDSDDVFIGRIEAGNRRLKLWLVFDPIRLEAARLVDVVENWIDKPANSMLT